jgi:hypothetical protein
MTPITAVTFILLERASGWWCMRRQMRFPNPLPPSATVGFFGRCLGSDDPGEHSLGWKTELGTVLFRDQLSTVAQALSEDQLFLRHLAAWG